MNLINHNLINEFLKLFNLFLNSKYKKIYRKETSLTLSNTCITVKFQCLSSNELYSQKYLDQ